METVTVSGHIAIAISEKLEQLAIATEKSQSVIIGEAVKAYVEEQYRQIEEIKKGIDHANQGRFASDEKIRRTFAKYGVNVDED